MSSNSRLFSDPETGDLQQARLPQRRRLPLLLAKVMSHTTPQSSAPVHAHGSWSRCYPDTLVDVPLRRKGADPSNQVARLFRNTSQLRIR